MEKFARKNSVTGKGMNEGYVFNDGEKYFETEKELITFLRSREEVLSELTNEFILKESYDLEEYYYTTWEEDENYYDEDGNEYTNCHDCGEETTVNEEFYFCTSCLTHL
jgi:hypothetical protein